ncbi:MAG: MarR family transcriptional regulator [Solirubrobacteraceae bacterium]|nr:MarR family transcriptional regulator [Solirubrobacteraceae bacterium]
MAADPVDRIVEQWGAVRPDLDTQPMAIMGRVHRLSQDVAGRVEQHFRAHGISRGDYDVLASLRRAGDPPVLTPAQLGGGLLLSSAGVTGRIDRLERAGLVERRPHPDDGRGVLVALTAQGRELVDRLVSEDMERQAAWVEALSDRERATLTRLLSKLAAGVERDDA